MVAIPLVLEVVRGEVSNRGDFGMGADMEMLGQRIYRRGTREDDKREGVEFGLGHALGDILECVGTVDRNSRKFTPQTL